MMFGSAKKDTFCAFCSLPQRVFNKKHIGFFQLIAFAGVSMILTFLVWRDFHWVGPMMFAALTLAGELMNRLRWRRSVVCRNCGFDPISYMRSPDEAATTVKAFLAHRKVDPLYLLRPQPKIKPFIKKVDKYSPPKKSSNIEI